MLNKYPLWKNLLIILVVAVGIIYALPNLYPDDFAVQVTGANVSIEVDQSAVDRATQALDQAGISYKSAEMEEGSGLIRFDTAEAQLAARKIVSRSVGDQYVVALNLAPTTPEWLLGLGAGPMKLGLDLRGGVHFLLEVDMEKALTQKLEVYASELKSQLRREKIRYRGTEIDDQQQLVLRFLNEEARDQAHDYVRMNYAEFTRRDSEDDKYAYLTLALSENTVREIEDYAVQQNLTTLRNRVNELGVAEPLVQRQGRNRIVVELPGVQDTATAKRVLGRTANLEFRLEAKPDASSLGTEEFSFKDNPRRTALLERDLILTGDSVSNARPAFDENGMPQVDIVLDSKGGKMMTDATRNAVQRRMAVLFIEHKSSTQEQQINGQLVQTREKTVEKGIISLATIQTTLGSRFRITGLDSAAEASELALLLRAGALAAPIYFVEERTVGPTLGQENIDAGIASVQLGFALVLIFMLVYYRVFGLFANVALAVNLLMLVAVMSLFSATLTLPGIAGIVLTVGMAVDANVLIFARIREELANGMPPQSAINAGYDRAFVSIVDANITTLLVAVILFAVGTGPVKGFAITLSVGILTSMFTAIVLTRALVNMAYGGRNVNKLAI